MNTKTTAILTFIVTVVVPFIQELADFISAFNTGSVKSSMANTIREVGFEISQDLQASSENKKSVEDYAVQTVALKKDSPSVENSWSRFFKSKR